jgi:DNA-binding CsgD family transcriptional regulator
MRGSPERALESVVVLAILSDPDFGLPGHDSLRTIFGLTDREASLARMIAGGWSLKQAAARDGIAHNTARVHLAKIMAKTGTHSQAALAALLRGLPPDAGE